MISQSEITYDVFISDQIPQAVAALLPNGDHQMWSPMSSTLILRDLRIRGRTLICPAQRGPTGHPPRGAQRTAEKDTKEEGIKEHSQAAKQI